MKKMFAVVSIVLLLVGCGFLIYKLTNKNLEEIKELTPPQISKMVDLGIIHIYADLPKNRQDKFTELIYITQRGNCYLYRDIFGRYYCRW